MYTPLNSFLNLNQLQIQLNSVPNSVFTKGFIAAASLYAINNYGCTVYGTDRTLLCSFPFFHTTACTCKQTEPGLSLVLR